MSSPDAAIDGGVGKLQSATAGRVQTGIGQFGDEDRPHANGHDGHHQSRGLRLVTGKQLNMQKLAGEQDNSNRAHYAKWCKNSRDYIESKGQDGIEPVGS